MDDILSFLPTTSRFNDEVIQKTIGEIRTFLDELANGTSNYRSLHNLTEQVEHQYHGRFLIELLQNAHDALLEDQEEGDEGRLEIVVALQEEPFGALYVANDGHPFTKSNFESLSKFGQSDKDPEKHIGNKGIGFRSVLEITKTPEVYSREGAGRETFNGYCFRFDPNAALRFKEPILQLLQGIDRPGSPLNSSIPMVEWSDEKIVAFRVRCSSSDRGWLFNELRYLSPYLLPIPIMRLPEYPTLQDFAYKGFATVIRLPFLSEKARAQTISEVEDLDANAVLFLDRVKSLWVDSGGSQKLIQRTSQPLKDPQNGYEIQIHVAEVDQNVPVTQRYWLWRHQIGGAENPTEAVAIREAVSGLPGKWPELQKATVGLAVRLGGIPEPGRINIFLPSALPSGCAAQINGPFYGDISRTAIDFGKPFNQLLLGTIARKALNIIHSRLAGRALDEARAIIDILAPLPDTGDYGRRWWSLLQQTASGREPNVREFPFALTDTGWNSFRQSKLLPVLNNPVVISGEKLRSKATFPVYHAGMDSRKDQILNLCSVLGINCAPSQEALAETLEKIAEELHQEGAQADWSGFWNDVSRLLPNSPTALAGKRVLLGTDNELHASNGLCSVFFRPRSGGTDDEVLGEGAIEDIPGNLRPLIAFLNDRVQVHAPRAEGGFVRTPIHRYLDSSLVQPFGVEQILKGVLITATPPLPIPLGSENDALCSDIIRWGVRLLNSLIAKDKGEKTLRYLGSLPVPCRGGWFPLSEACFGPGWNGTVGYDLQKYLEGAGSPECREAMDRLMLPPDHELWGGDIISHRDLLSKAGAFDGLRLIKISVNLWQTRFYVSGGRAVQLPAAPPPCFETKMWSNYAEYVSETLKPRFGGEFPYEIQELFVLPGLDGFSKFDPYTRLAFMRAVLRSLSVWGQEWKTLSINKVGGDRHVFEIESPLHFWLRHNVWLAAAKEEGFDFFSPMERWYIPSLSFHGRFHQFSHLNPMPVELAAKLDRDADLVAILEGLGMPSFDPEKSSTNIRLLADLADALENPEIEVANRDVFLGQVRLAWSLFDPGENSIFPSRIIVQNIPAGLHAIAPNPEDPVYLPDATSTFLEGLELHSKPIVAIEPKDAKRLADGFRRAYGTGIRLASGLRMQPIVNGEPWKGDAVEFFSDSELKWLIPVILSIFAYSGNLARGTQTKTFVKALENLREVKVHWAHSIEACLWQGEECVLTTPVSALWLSKTKTLLALSESLNKPSLLSESLGAIVDRSDLDILLRLVLSKLDHLPERTGEILSEALRQLKISESHLAEVEQIWLGDLSWTMRLLRPVLFVFSNKESNQEALTEVNSPEGLRVFLEKQNLGPLRTDDILEVLRKSNTFHHLGSTLYELFGGTFQLGRWNQALTHLNESPVKNEDAAEQFKYHLECARVPLRSIMRRIVRDHPGAFLFNDLTEDLDNTQCPEEYGDTYWNVKFELVMQQVKLFYVKVGASSEEINAIDQAKSVEDLIQSLHDLELEPTVDPLQIYAQNRDCCQKLLEKVQQAGILWSLRTKASSSYWDKDVDDLMLPVDAILEREGFADLWNNAGCFAALKNLSHDELPNSFWEKLAKASGFETFVASLGISVEELGSAKERLEHQKEKVRERKRMVTVCGKDFDSAEDNLGELWNHINENINEKALPEISPDRIAKLKEISSRPRSPGNGGSRTRLTKPRGRMSKAKKNLIGLAGEIHAYRVLLKTYGPTVINPDCWKSENGLRKFPNRIVDDSFGCDFVVNHRGKTYHIEVKATEGNEESFELGVTEIRHAVKVANKKNLRFVILHITKALSSEPEYHFLPNPYDRQYQKSYDIENAGLRIRYRKA